MSTTNDQPEPPQSLRVPTWREHFLDPILQPGQAHQPRPDDSPPTRRLSQPWPSTPSTPPAASTAEATGEVHAGPAPSSLRPLATDAPDFVARMLARASTRLTGLAHRLDPDRP